MNRAPIIATLALAGWFANLASGADCAAMHGSFDNAASVAANGGAVTGALTFVDGINEACAAFDGVAFVTYARPEFADATASLSLWVRKSSDDTAGGIAEIGTLGQPNSVGIFYNNQRDLYFEMRDTNGTWAAVAAPLALSQSDWTHVAALWSEGGGRVRLWLFVNGKYAGGTELAGDFDPVSQQLRVGSAGYYGNGAVRIDELRFFDWPLLDDEAHAEYVYSSNRFVAQPTAKPISTGPVQVSGKQLLVNGTPYTVRGVGYQPIPVGINISGAAIASTYTDAAILARDMPLLRAMHVNTIRTWSQPPDNALLDACYNGGVDTIRVIVGFWVDTGADYADPATTAAIESDFRALVHQFKDHPAVLAWGIGNENNLAYAGDLADWYALANRLAEAAYAEEGPSYHPTVVINGGLRDLGDVDCGSDDASLSFVDMWGNNAYPGESFHCYFDYFDRISAKPVVITEYGVDAYNGAADVEDQVTQAAYVVSQWRELSAACVGGSVMAYSDEWWKWSDPAVHDTDGFALRYSPDGEFNEEWWGLFAAQDNGAGPDVLTPRLVVDALAAEFDDCPSDVTGDGSTDISDLGAVLADFGCVAACAGDADGDGDVDITDLGLVLAAFGQSCP